MKGLYAGIIQGLCADIELDNKWITEKITIILKQKQQLAMMN